MRFSSAAECLFQSRLTSMSSSMVSAGSGRSATSHLRQERGPATARAREAVEVEHGLADVAERGAHAQVRAGIHALHLGDQRRVLAAVVGRRGRGVAAVVGRDDEPVSYTHLTLPTNRAV